MRAALADADCAPSEIGHINAHGLATRSSDVDEAQAISDVFGSDQPQVPVVAAKSYFGNLGAGSGIIELVASLMAMSEGHLFPVRNYENADPECPVNVVTDCATQPGSVALAVNVTPQGQAAAIVVRSWAA